jgi:hypothetical protein
VGGKAIIGYHRSKAWHGRVQSIIGSGLGHGTTGLCTTGQYNFFSDLLIHARLIPGCESGEELIRDVSALSHFVCAANALSYRAVVCE